MSTGSAIAVIAAGLCCVASSPQSAQAQQAQVAAPAEGAFAKDWALGSYAVGVEGGYSALGVGGRLRWEPLSWAGLDLFAEVAFVDQAGGARRDIPIGFSLYVPFEILDGLRLRVMAGACASFSVIEPAEPEAPDAEDVLFGVHAGAGAELALGSLFSLFVDAQWFGYWGHERTVDGWTGDLSEEIGRTDTAQFNVGLQLHL